MSASRWMRDGIAPKGRTVIRQRYGLEDPFSAVIEHPEIASRRKRPFNDVKLEAIPATNVIEGDFARNELGASDPLKLVDDLSVTNCLSSRNQQRFLR